MHAIEQLLKKMHNCCGSFVQQQKPVTRATCRGSNCSISLLACFTSELRLATGLIWVSVGRCLCRLASWVVGLEGLEEGPAALESCHVHAVSFCCACAWKEQQGAHVSTCSSMTSIKQVHGAKNSSRSVGNCYEAVVHSTQRNETCRTRYQLLALPVFRTAAATRLSKIPTASADV
jgi:hypothetical protein